MNRYRFDISVNDFLLKTHFSYNEQPGLEYCKKYMTRFQRQVANLQMKVIISEKEMRKNLWEYHGEPYLYKKTLIRKPLIKRSNDEQ